MTRRSFLIAAMAAAAQTGARRKPNIVLLLADDLGYGELGCQGNPQIPTPHIDSIAAAGVRFTQGYVTAPFCAPSRAGIITGRYQTRFGHERNVVGKANLDPKTGLPLSESTIADRLKSAGYRTACIGKWHLGTTEDRHPMRRGFDEFFGFLHEGHFFYPPPYRGAVTRLRVNEPPYDDNNPLLRGTQPVEEKEYLTHAITREALAFIDRNADRPFFLYVPFNAVHSPMQAPTADLKRFNSIGDEHRQLFAAMLTSLDDAIGRILARLREKNLEEDTLIFFLSDNGGPTAELTSGNGILRGGKGQMWEGGLRVAFLAQWKGRVPAGRTLAQPVISLDIQTTALAAAGAPAPSGTDGKDLLPLLTGKSAAPPHERLFWRMGDNIALREGDWKLVRQLPSKEFGLYDLAADPSEKNDLAAARPEIAARLRAALEKMEEGMVPPLW